MAEKIFIASDNQATLQTLSSILLKAGYDVASSKDGQTALEILETEEIDVALVALDLPDMSGIKILQKVDEVSPDTKIIVVAEQGSMETVIEAIRYQAHDYILKPFDHKEMLSIVASAIDRRNKEKRIRLLLEQLGSTLQQLKDEMGISGAPKPSRQLISLSDGVSIDFTRREMWRGSERIGLTPTEGKLMEILVTNRSRVMAHTDLTFLILGYEVNALEAPEILRPLISRLRKKLAVFPGGKKWIISVRGTGYVFDPELLN